MFYEIINFDWIMLWEQLGFAKNKFAKESSQRSTTVGYIT